jgi:hypothetical protein
MLDNASNNNTIIDNTMIEGIAQRADREGITLNPAWARLRCMPHTMHLAAVRVFLFYFFLTVLHIIYLDYQLLEAISAISRSDAQKASSRKGNYQDATTASLSRMHDDEAAGQEDGDQPEGDITLLPDQSGSILSAVDKASYFQLHSYHVLSVK